MRPLVLALTLALLALGPSRGFAADPGTVFAEGRKLYDDGQLEQALAKFHETLDISGSPNARLYVARCLQDMGRLPEAYEQMERTAREAAEKAATDPKYEDTRDAAASQLAIMGRQIGKLIVTLAGASAQATVQIDGQDVASDKLGVPIPIMPKAVVVRATAPGKAPAERTVQVVAGETVTVLLELVAPPSPAATAARAPTRSAAAPPAEGEGETESGAFGPLRIVGVVAGAIGVAGGVTAAVAGSMVANRRAKLEDECGGTHCLDASYQDVIDDGRRLQLVTNIGFVVGGVGLASAVALLIFGGPSEDEGTTTGSTTLGIGREGGFVGYTGRF